ncbi:ecto-ADP-ribosyltransferase 5-like isoform X2 [Betta splendens]|uniref:NAD(P)(+)--arginine ADP-ribosyltransferase n=1 Tax=Betta splendens TaxID=158456 RepID=A0A6P7L5Y3_BETSP|nr:ecto-ADP-ribosyltransferase 5-like isoform X2 [Betta splendens]
MIGTVLLLCFLFSWIRPVDARMVHLDPGVRGAEKAVQLSLAKDSVDDMFFGCSAAMTELVKNTLFKKENKGMFADVWKGAEACAVKNLKKRKAEDEALTKQHMQAICAYTSDEDGDFYNTFNQALRRNMKNYGAGFPFHTLYFWLTSAVQLLNNNKKCHTTFRRTNLDFTGKVSGEVRFGSFASSSYKPTLVDFGNKTCFRIRTCLGASLRSFSVVKEEEEVLIAPYEIFKITAKKKGCDVPELVGCRVVYMLQSVGLLSNLNCKLVNAVTEHTEGLSDHGSVSDFFGQTL